MAATGECAVLSRELLDLPIAVDHLLTQTFVLLLNVDDIGRRGLDARQLPAHVIVVLACMVELRLRVAELRSELSDLALELRHTRLRIVRRALRDREAVA